MDKYSAEWIKQEFTSRNVTRLPHHDCSICGQWVGYLIGDLVEFDPSCDCCAGSGAELRSYHDIASWLSMQKSDEVRDSIMARAV